MAPPEGVVRRLVGEWLAKAETDLLVSAESACACVAVARSVHDEIASRITKNAGR